MTSVLWGLAQLGKQSFKLRLKDGTVRDLVDRILRTVPTRVDAMHGNSVCRFVHGLSLLFDELDPGCLDPVLEHARVSLLDERVHILSLVQFLRSLASLRYKDDVGVAGVIATQLALRLEGLSGSDISEVVWALGKLKCAQSNAFLMKIRNMAQTKGFSIGKMRMSPEEILRLVGGLAELDTQVVSEGVVKGLCGQLVKRRVEFTAQQTQEFTYICERMGIETHWMLST